MCLPRSDNPAAARFVAIRRAQRAPFSTEARLADLATRLGGGAAFIVEGMCRNITELRGLDPAATPEEIAAAARQYVRKVSGVTRPSAANVGAFEAAVAEVTQTTARLLAALPPRRQPPKTVPPLRRPEVVARLAAAT
jgi:hypothetical protein